MTYRQRDDISRLIDDFIEYNDATYDFRSDDGIVHQLWVIDDAETIVELESHFRDIDILYIADGHHRTASAANVSLKRREEFPDAPADAEQNYSMAVIFPDEDLYIMDYNRLVKDLNGLSADEFLNRLGKIYGIEKVEDAFHPTRKGEICMYLGGEWYALTAPDSIYEGLDPVNRLDVSVLQNNVLAPILGVEDPRTCERIDFVGGIRGQMCIRDRCLALPPGLSLCSISERALKAAEQVENRGYYLDILRLYKRVAKDFQYPSTPSLSHMFALDYQLDRILEEGLDNRFARHKLLADKVRAWAEKHFALFAAEGYRSNTVTCISTPPEFVFSELSKPMLERGYRLGGGYGDFKSSTFRIATMGELQEETLDEVIAAMNEILGLEA